MISSNLQSQLFGKIATWDILTTNNLVWGHRCPMRISQLKIEVWSTVVYVHLPANPTSRVSPQGISRFISMWGMVQKPGFLGNKSMRKLAIIW